MSNLSHRGDIVFALCASTSSFNYMTYAQKGDCLRAVSFFYNILTISHLCEVPTNGGVQDMIVISPKACLMLIFKKVLRAGCDEESAVFHVGEELLEELLADAA